MAPKTEELFHRGRRGRREGVGVVDRPTSPEPVEPARILGSIGAITITVSLASWAGRSLARRVKSVTPVSACLVSGPRRRHGHWRWGGGSPERGHHVHRVRVCAAATAISAETATKTLRLFVQPVPLRCHPTPLTSHPPTHPPTRPWQEFAMASRQPAPRRPSQHAPPPASEDVLSDVRKILHDIEGAAANGNLDPETMARLGTTPHHRYHHHEHQHHKHDSQQ